MWMDSAHCIDESSHSLRSSTRLGGACKHLRIRRVNTAWRPPAYLPRTHLRVQRSKGRRVVGQGNLSITPRTGELAEREPFEKISNRRAHGNQGFQELTTSQCVFGSMRSAHVSQSTGYGTNRITTRIATESGGCGSRATVAQATEAQDSR